MTGELETLALFGTERPGNPTVLRDGRVLVSMSAIIQPDYAVRAIGPDGVHVTYPNPAWAGKPQADGQGLAGVIGIRADADDIVWILDLGDGGHQPKLVAWDDRAKALHRVIVLPQNVLRPSSFAQDFVIDARRQRIYIADMTLNEEGFSDYPAIIVVDLKTGLARRVLENHEALRPSGEPVIIDGRPLARPLGDGESAVYGYGFNPIAIDPLGRWVYTGALSGRAVHRIDAALLAHECDDAVLAPALKYWCAKPHCDGFDVDAAGNVYVTDIENYAIGKASPEGYTVLAQDRDRLGWPDGVELDAEGRWLYITANQLHRLPVLNGGVDDSKPPYHVLRLRVDAPMSVREAS
ncbi:L-dopachrome tautomerase-related protein [Sphingomonas sp. OTU376]|uniref:L-dopachrome tautomerase-related protein n=1 Tax=Sphingomonas sp. OTU376 TaxID=3043863 RepID=UPI00313CE448